MAKHWIHSRHMRHGGSINKNPSNQRKGPLRRIVETIRASTGMFDPAWVELQCGHKTHSHGMFRARCSQCASLSTPTDGSASPDIGRSGLAQEVE